MATNSEGGTADEIYLRGIHAALAQAASGFIVPTEVQVASPAPVEEALQRLLDWGGRPGCIGYRSEIVMGVVTWANNGMVGPLPPLPEPLRLREAAAPARPTPVDLAALHDPTFSDGLTAAQHRDVLRGGPDPRSPALGDVEELIDDLRMQANQGHCEYISGDDLRRAASLLAHQAQQAQRPLPTNNLAPVPVADRPWEQPGWCDDYGQCWWAEYQGPANGPVVRWTQIEPALWSLNGWLLPHWAIPTTEANPAKVQP